MIENLELVKRGSKTYKLNTEFNYAIPVNFIMTEKTKEFYEQFCPEDNIVTILSPFSLLDDHDEYIISDIYKKLTEDYDTTLSELQNLLNKTEIKKSFPIIINVGGRICKICDIPKYIPKYKDNYYIFGDILIKPLNRNSCEGRLTYTTTIFEDIMLSEFTERINSMLSKLNEYFDLFESTDEDSDISVSEGDMIDLGYLYFILLFGGDNIYLNIDDIENKMYDILSLLPDKYFE